MHHLAFFRSCALPSALALCAVPAAAQTVHVVGEQSGPGVHFTSLSRALDAAADGDVVLIKPGDYEADPEPGGSGAKLFTITGKSIDVVADRGGPVRLRHGTLSISGLSATQSVSLVGLDFPDSGLVAYQNNGVVLVRDCEFPAFKASNGPPTPLREINVTDTTAFLFEESTLEGFTTSTTFGPIPGTAFSASNSNIYLHDSVIRGGKGLGGKDGYDAVRMDGGSIYASGSLLLGGQGGDLFAFTGTCGGGGDGLLLLQGAAAETNDCTLVGGPAGNSCPAGLGFTGQPVDSLGGTHTIVGSQDHGLEVMSPVREGEAATLIAKGRSSDQVFLLLSVEAAVNPLAGIAGALFVDPAGLVVLPMGQIIKSSSESFPLTLGQLAPGLQSLTLSLQLAFVGFGASPSVSGTARLVVLDSAF